MSDRAALLAAIRSNPDDDLARLAYADWLDEQGTPADADRAGYVRAAVEVARLAADGSASAALAEFLERQADGSDAAEFWADADPGTVRRIELADRLREAHGRPTAKAEGVPRLRGVTFHNDAGRGFLHAVTVRDGTVFLRHADAIFAAGPIDEITFESLDPDEAKALAKSGHLARLRALKLPESAEPASLRVLGDSPDVAGVHTLELDSPDRPRAVVRALAAGRHWRVRRLRLENFWGVDEDVTRADLAALFRSPGFRGLVRLDCDNATLEGDDLAKAVASAGLRELRHLDLQFCTLGDEGALALAASGRLPNVRFLDLQYNNVGDEAAGRVIASPRLASLTALNMEGNEFAGPDPAALAGKCRPPTLRALALGGNRVTLDGLRALARCPATAGLWYVSLYGCEVTAGAGKVLAGSGWDSLVCLNLNRNRLSARSAEALAGWPGLTTVRDLDLAHNPLTAAGGKALAASPHLGKLLRLTLRKADVGEAAARTLAARFGRGVLTWL